MQLPRITLFLLAALTLAGQDFFSDGDSGHPLIRTRDIEHHCARGPGVCRVDRIGGSTKLVLDHIAGGGATAAAS